MSEWIYLWIEIHTGQYKHFQPYIASNLYTYEVSGYQTKLLKTGINTHTKGHCRISIFIYCPREFKISVGIDTSLLSSAQKKSYQCRHYIVPGVQVCARSVLHPGPGSERNWILLQLQQPLLTLFNAAVHFIFFF